MAQQEFYNILGRYLSGESSGEENRRLLSLVNSDEKLKREFEQVQKIWNAVPEEEKAQDWDVASAWKEAEKRMRLLEDSNKSVSDHNVGTHKTKIS